MSLMWSDEEIALLEALRPVCNTREIQKVFKGINLDRSMEAISKKSRQLGITFKDFGLPPTAGLAEGSQKSIEAMLSCREDQLVAIHPTIQPTSGQKSYYTVKVKDATAKMMAELAELRACIPRSSSVSVRKAEGDKTSLVLCCSDNHMGRSICDDDGIEIYNMAIAAKRILDTPGMIIKALGKEGLANCDEIVVLMIGDHIDGEGVFPAQEMMLEDHVANQVKHCVRAFWLMIKELRTHFPMVRVVTTRGNHGRGGISAESNWDTMVYQQLELLIDLEGDPNLTIKNRYGEFNTVDVKGWKGMIRHKAQQQSSTASGAIKFAGWQGIHNWDFFCFGHFHNSSWMSWLGKPILKNGSAMGADDYSEHLAVQDEAAQILFGVTEDNVMSFIIPLKYIGGE